MTAALVALKLVAGLALAAAILASLAAPEPGPGRRAVASADALAERICLVPLL